MYVHIRRVHRDLSYLVEEERAGCKWTSSSSVGGPRGKVYRFFPGEKLSSCLAFAPCLRRPRRVKGRRRESSADEGRKRQRYKVNDMSKKTDASSFFYYKPRYSEVAFPLLGLQRRSNARNIVLLSGLAQ